MKYLSPEFVVDEYGQEYPIIKQTITTISMVSQRKGIRDRVVMRRWVWYIDKSRRKKVALVLRGRSVLEPRNRHLERDFIIEHGLTDLQVQRYEEMFDKTIENYKKIASMGAYLEIDAVKRIHDLIDWLELKSRVEERHKFKWVNKYSDVKDWSELDEYQILEALEASTEELARLCQRAKDCHREREWRKKMNDEIA